MHVRYAAVVGLSGGLIGPPGSPRDYEGAFEGTPVFLGCSDIDPHIPVERVHESSEVFRRMGAAVDERIYPRMGHTVNQDEIDAVVRTATSLKRTTENTKKLLTEECPMTSISVEFQPPYMCVRRYDRRFRSCRATFQTSPQRTQRQYEASVTVLLVVMMSLERHSGQLVGGGAACGSGSERN